MVLLAETNGSKAQNEKFFANDLRTPHDCIVQIHIASDTALTAGEFQYTLNGGTNWVSFGNVEAPGANAGIVIQRPISKNSLFNLRHTNSSARTVLFCQVHI